MYTAGPDVKHEETTHSLITLLRPSLNVWIQLKRLRSGHTNCSILSSIGIAGLFATLGANSERWTSGFSNTRFPPYPPVLNRCPTYLRAAGLLRVI
ncbi:hypothetical protein M404DRAFT_995492 [Pisolithus tinctorius Marx 270]|uniref:Uncharacterized protein n=1 Tax=Pisolithus tinctorius Marx 270 TaxID=870435 RepID=A0A0C3JMA5_PISTI|nr:hypothetical protein M404DRAFT_995492 [Pisolithus tinctorius Marx 270]